jgi:hypothetical protein
MKNITRRKFIGAAAATAGAAFSLNSTTLGTLTPSNTYNSLARLDWTTFSRYQNTNFRFSKLGIGQVNLTLDSVEDTRQASESPGASGEECFVLRFAGNRAELLQDTYDVKHSALGNFKLFITEGQTEGSTRTYLAVINRITS